MTVPRVGAAGGGIGPATGAPPLPPPPLKLLLVPPPFFLPPRLPRLEKPPGGALEVPCGVWCGGCGGVAGGREVSEGPLPPLVPQ
jgi:hypothetical protein